MKPCVKSISVRYRYSNIRNRQKIIVDAYSVFADKTQFEQENESILRHESSARFGWLGSLRLADPAKAAWGRINLILDAICVSCCVSVETSNYLLPVQLAQESIGLIQPAHAVGGPAGIGVGFSGTGLVGLADRRDRDRGSGLCG